MKTHQFEVIVIGAGGAGLMAGLYASKTAKTAIISKLYPTRSHTGTAQGGIGAALGNEEEDHPEWHTFDSVKGSDYLGDQDAIEFMCFEAVQAIYELEHMGLPFDRTKDGKISQRPFGGHTNNITGKPVRRACHAADRTGHMILQTLYQQCLKNNVNFFDEFQVVDLLMVDGKAAGVVAIELASGEMHTFHAKSVVFATGGHGRIWEITSNAYAFTGDGPAIFMRRGLPLEDMEFFQFHPTGIYKLGILITEGVRGEGGVLINGKGERFMENYAPKVKDLASRDVISRAIYMEIREGRGINGQNYVYLDVRPELVNRYATLDGRKNLDGSPVNMTGEEILAKLPDIVDFCRVYLGVDPVTQMMPIQPTAHYAMGGIPTNKYGEALLDEKNTVIPGLYAAGECACVSIHGANRLGTNSLLDLVVFGKHAGLKAAEYAHGADYQPLPEDPGSFARAQFERIRQADGKENAFDIGRTMKKVMFDDMGIFRSGKGMQNALDVVRELKERYKHLSITDKGAIFNMELMNVWELGNLLDLAEVTTVSALARTESRGGHSREDYPDRDDVNWLKHTLSWVKDDGRIDLKYKPVVITKYQPKVRTYEEAAMEVTIKIFRYNPEKDKKPSYKTYKLEAPETDRVLDLLEKVKGYQDGTLSFRRSCAHGICGSDAMRINGFNRLACKTLVRDTGAKITVEPILGLRVIKDLIVDMEPFFEHYKEVKPWLINDDPEPEKERYQSPEDRALFDDTTKCILCACCTTSCPSFWGSDKYVGPAAIVAAHRFIFDSRDKAAAERLKILNDVWGIHRCHTVFNCTMACPREIQVTKAIGEVKMALSLGKLD